MLDDAICIRHWDWSETSQTVTLFCRSLGVVRGLAKGSKRPKSPFSGGIELLTRGRVGVILKPTSELATLTEWDLTHTYPALRESLRANMAGQYLADLVNQFVRDHDPHPGLFDAMHMGLSMLHAGRAEGGGGGGGGGGRGRTDESAEGGASRGTETVWQAVVSFQWATLVETGFKPELDHDVRTGEVLVERGGEDGASGRPAAPDATGAASSGGTPIALGFDPHAGGVVPDPGPPSSNHEAASVWRVRAATIEYLRAVERHEPGTVFTNGGRDARPTQSDDVSVPHDHGRPAETLPSDPVTIERAARLLGAYLRHVLGHQPPTHEGLFGRDQPSTTS